MRILYTPSAGDHRRNVDSNHPLIRQFNSRSDERVCAFSFHAAVLYLACSKWMKTESTHSHLYIRMTSDRRTVCPPQCVCIHVRVLFVYVFVRIFIKRMVLYRARRSIVGVEKSDCCAQPNQCSTTNAFQHACLNGHIEPQTETVCTRSAWVKRGDSITDSVTFLRTLHCLTLCGVFPTLTP